MCDEDQNVLIYEGWLELDGIYQKIIPQIFEKIHLNGPLAGEKLTELKLTITNLRLNYLDEEAAFSELSAMFYESMKKGLIQAEQVLLEPIYHTIVQLPPDNIKNTHSLFSKYSAKVKDIYQENDYQATIDVLLPVRNSVKFGEDIRSITSGRAFWQNEFYAFLEIPPGESEKIISELRFSKGLSW
jgi:translation elongation factor EF-G